MLLKINKTSSLWYAEGADMYYKLCAECLYKGVHMNNRTFVPGSSDNPWFEVF